MLELGIELDEPLCAQKTSREIENLLQRCGGCLDLMAAMFDQWQGDCFVSQFQSDEPFHDKEQYQQQLLDVMNLYHEYAEDARAAYGNAVSLVEGRPLVDRHQTQAYKQQMKRYRERFAQITRYCQAYLADL